MLPHTVYSLKGRNLDEEKSKTRWYVIKDQKNDPAVFLYRPGASAFGTDVWLSADRQYYYVLAER